MHEILLDALVSVVAAAIVVVTKEWVRRRKARKLQHCENLLPLVRQAKEARDLRELAEWFLSDDEEEDIQLQENADSIEVEVNSNIDNSSSTKR
ncbi:373_t:CDS:2 [Paraglomus occultum]|uniref:373_t:CDS:1 n=1 Tax=Paraglomus occultum TaxID=144539 RepID=A0A9N9FRV8_9GLOM|nr:373_t:CDS:2 [Paraglomus occultum]